MLRTMKDTPRSRPNGSAAVLSRRINPVRKSQSAGEAERLLEELRRMAEQQNQGQVDARVPVESFDGSERAIAQAVNDMMGSQTTEQRKVMACLDRLAAGDFDAPMEQVAGQKSLANDTVERL